MLSKSPGHPPHPRKKSNCQQKESKQVTDRGREWWSHVVVTVLLSGLLYPPGTYLPMTTALLSVTWICAPRPLLPMKVALLQITMTIHEPLSLTLFTFVLVGSMVPSVA